MDDSLQSSKIPSGCKASKESSLAQCSVSGLKSHPHISGWQSRLCSSAGWSCPWALGSSILTYRRWASLHFRNHWGKSLAPRGCGRSEIPDCPWIALLIILPFLWRTLLVQRWIVLLSHPLESLKSNSVPLFCPTFSVFFNPSWQCFCHIFHFFFNSNALLRIPKSVLVCSGCHNTKPQTKWLKPQKFIFSQFRRLEVQD